MKISPVMIRTLSMLGQRGAFGLALTDIAENNRQIVALSADLCNTSGLDRFLDHYPERFFNTGIAEQNLIGVAAGMADQGIIPFAATFANFATMRACEQVRHFMGYMCCNIKLVGFGAGYAMQLFGNTHYGMEDIAVLRAISNLTLISPSDSLEVVKCVEAAAMQKGPVYLRLTGLMNQPMIYSHDFDFVIGKAIWLSEGMDVAIIATGSILAYVQKAAQMLEEKGIQCAVVNMHTLKPIDEQAILQCAKRKLLVTVEEHSVTGGLGSAVAEVITQEISGTSLIRLGIPQGYRNAGCYEYMLQQSRLTASQIAEDIYKKFKEVE